MVQAGRDQGRPLRGRLRARRNGEGLLWAGASAAGVPSTARALRAAGSTVARAQRARPRRAPHARPARRPRRGARQPPQVSAEDYLAAKPDPVAQFAAPVCGHMNAGARAAEARARAAVWGPLRQGAGPPQRLCRDEPRAEARARRPARQPTSQAPQVPHDPSDSPREPRAACFCSRNSLIISYRTHRVPPSPKPPPPHTHTRPRGRHPGHGQALRRPQRD